MEGSGGKGKLRKRTFVPSSFGALNEFSILSNRS